LGCDLRSCAEGGVRNLHHLKAPEVDTVTLETCIRCAAHHHQQIARDATRVVAGELVVWDA
jgi:hypothetical protein